MKNPAPDRPMKTKRRAQFARPSAAAPAAVGGPLKDLSGKCSCRTVGIPSPTGGSIVRARLQSRHGYPPHEYHPPCRLPRRRINTPHDGGQRHVRVCRWALNTPIALKFKKNFHPAVIFLQPTCVNDTTRRSRRGGRVNRERQAGVRSGRRAARTDRRRASSPSARRDRRAARPRPRGAWRGPSGPGPWPRRWRCS